MSDAFLTFSTSSKAKAHGCDRGTCLDMQEEAEAITEIADPGEAAWSILDRLGAATQWCIIKLGGEGALLCTKDPRRQYRQSGVQVCTSAYGPS